MAKQWSNLQTAIYDAVRTTDEHLIVQARAGSGKTTTILEALNHVPRGKRTLLCAFNKSIRDELADRAPRGVHVKTMHSIGMGCLSARGKVIVDAKKTLMLIKAVLTEEMGPLFSSERVAKLSRLVGLAKNTLVIEPAELAELACAFGIDDEDKHRAEDLARQANAVMLRCAEDTRIIDFDDMIWLPAYLKIAPQPFDVVFVDEAQDLNPCQRWMVEQLIRNGGRLVAVGDDRQAIYGWRGAGQNVLAELEAQFKARVLPLSITYRCAKKIVAIAQEVVPDYRAADSAPEGEILSIGEDKLTKSVAVGDFVLSRANAPLMGVALSLIKKGIPAVITGRDVGASLATLARKSNAKTIEKLLTWLDSYERRQAARLLPDHEAQYETVADRCACLRELAEDAETVESLCRNIEALFSDLDDTKVVTCSTVHRAKGLERDRVFLLAQSFKKTGGEEDNIRYVAVTRARNTLVYVA